MRLKDVAKLNIRTLDDSTSGDYVFKYIDISSVSFEEGIVLGENISFRNAPSRARRIVRKGDVLISTVRTYLRAIADVDWDAENIIASTGFAIFTPDENINPRFLAYAVKSSDVINQICSMSKGVSYPAIQAPIISSVNIPFYILAEQEAIAAYLDKECGKIGKEIGLLERKVDCYRRLRYSLINRTVIHGINPNVTMKPSGNSWIADIPMHWNIKPIRSFITLISPEKRGKTEYQLLSVTRDNGVIVRGERGEDGNNNRIPDDLSNYKVVKRNQFVVNKMKAWMGAYGVSKYQGIVSPAYYICDVHDVYEPFFSIAIRCHQYINFFWRYSKGIRVDQWDMSPLALKEIPFVTPPIEEQREIVAYLDDKCGKIDAIIKKIESKIERLKALRRSLINEVVTGQRAIN